jgi:hypothetical protein
VTRKMNPPSGSLLLKFLAPATIAAAMIAISVAAFPSSSTDTEKPKFIIDEDCPVFAFSPDNHVAYAVRRIYNWKKFTVEGDDLWISNEAGNKRKKIIEGDRLVKTTTFHSYSIHDITWSPDSRRLTIEKTTEQINSAKKGDISSGETIELMDSDGHEIPIKGMEPPPAPPKPQGKSGDKKNQDQDEDEDENEKPKFSPFIGASQGTWLADGATVAFLFEAVKPNLLFEIHTIQPATGKVKTLFAGHLFAGVVWDPAHSTAFAVQRDKGTDGPADLLWLDLAHEIGNKIAPIDGFQGQLTVSPSGKRVGYFRDGDYLEIRDITPNSKPLSLRVGYGRFEWSPDERYILLKRGPETRSGNMVWISIPGGDFTPAMHDLVFRDFHISPDGHWIGLMEVGKRIVKIYPASTFAP